MADRFPSADSVIKTGATYAKDITERVLWTGVAAVTGVVIAAGPADMLDAGFWETAGTAGLVAVVSFVKGLAARLIGDSNSASTARGV